MQRKYTLTYHHNGRTHTMELTQNELDNILAIGDAYPLEDSETQKIKYDITANKSDDDRIWWGNHPLPSSMKERLLSSGLFQIVKPVLPLH